jgi:hypothetical protein
MDDRDHERHHMELGSLTGEVSRLLKSMDEMNSNHLPTLFRSIGKLEGRVGFIVWGLGALISLNVAALVRLLLA